MDQADASARGRSPTGTEVDVRRPEPADAGEVARFLSPRGLDTTAAELRAWWAAPSPRGLDSVRVVLGPGGETVGYASLAPLDRAGSSFLLDLRLARPAQQATVLDPLVRELTAQAERIAGRRAADVLLTGRAEVTEPGAEELLARHGLAVTGGSFLLGRDLVEVPEPGRPAGVELRSFRPEADARAVYELHMETFVEAPHFVPEPFDEWADGTIRRADFDPELWILGVAGRELAGICLARQHREPRVGWVAVLAVRRPWRRRGVGVALLRHTLGRLRARGAETVGLAVDVESETGMRELALAADFEIVDRVATFERRLAGGGRRGRPPRVWGRIRRATRRRSRER